MTTHTVTSRDTTIISYERTGDGPPLVLVHGTTADRGRWRAITPQLAQDATVYALDRRGRGGSANDPADYSLAREFEDVATVVTAAADQTGQPVNLLGHSYGAICALGGAGLAAGAVRRLMLYEPPLGVGGRTLTPGLIERLERLLAQGQPAEVVEVFFREEVGLPASELALLRTLPTWPARVAAAHTLPRELRAARDFDPRPDWFAAVKAPTLLLRGGDSPPSTEQATELVRTSLPAGAQVEVMPGQQHIAMDTAPDLFIGHVRAFLTERVGDPR